MCHIQLELSHLQKLVLSKYKNGDGTTKNFLDLNGAISLSTVERCCGRIRVDFQEQFEQKQRLRRRLNGRKPLFSRKLARELDISRGGVQRILKNDREIQAYKMRKGNIAH